MQFYQDNKDLVNNLLALLSGVFAVVAAIIGVWIAKGQKKSDDDQHRRNLETVETLVRIARERDGNDADRLGQENSMTSFANSIRG